MALDPGSKCRDLLEPNWSTLEITPVSTLVNSTPASATQSRRAARQSSASAGSRLFRGLLDKRTPSVKVVGN